MGLFKNIKDGFRGKPDFSSLHGKMYQVDNHLLTFSVPHNVTSSSDYHKKIKLDDFDCSSNIEHHEIALKMGYVEYYCNTKVVNPLLPVNSPGKVFLRVKLKKSNLYLDDTESLSCFLEKNHFEYFHDPIVSGDSMRGMHTKLMNKAHDFANRCWGENPESQEDVKEKQEFLLDSFLRAYPPIKCEEVYIGNHVFSKYKEGNIDLLNRCSQFYNIQLFDDYFITIEFHYEIEQSMASRKFVEWVRTADEHFERSILETVELSRVGDSVINKVSRSV